MKNLINKNFSKIAIVVVAMSVSNYCAAETAFTNNLSPLEKSTVTAFQKISENGQVNSAVAKTKDLEKDIEYLNSHEQESVIAKNSQNQNEAIYNSLSKQLLKSFFGKYEDEIKNKWLTIDLSGDSSDSKAEVVSYDRETFELTMRSRKNKVSSVSSAEEKRGRWKLKPKLSTPGAALIYTSTNMSMEFKMTTAEKVINLNRSLKQLAIDTSYNIDLANSTSALVVSKSLTHGLNLQMEKIGKGVSAFSGSEQRVSLNFGQAF